MSYTLKVFNVCNTCVCSCSSQSFSSPSFSSPSFSSPSFSSPANSTPATLSVIFQSCKFHPCDFVRHFPVLQIPPPVFRWSVIFHSCKFQSPATVRAITPFKVIQGHRVWLLLLRLTPDEGVPPETISVKFLSKGQGWPRYTKWRRNTAENFSRLSRVHERYRRQTTDRRTGDDI